MKILGVDPSISRLGWAVLEGSRVLQSGFISPPSKVKTTQGRIDHQVDALADVWDEQLPRITAMEVPSGKPGRQWTGNNDWGRSSLAKYGWLVGEVRRMLILLHGEPDRVIAIDERAWTRSRSKAQRQAEVRMLFPEYDAEADGKGMDVSDAIGIALHVQAVMAVKDSRVG